MTALSPTQIELLAYHLRAERELIVSPKNARELLRGYNPGAPNDRQSRTSLPCRPAHQNPQSDQWYTGIIGRRHPVIEC